MKKRYHTLIIGTGCAGFNAADRLYDLGIKDIAVITEGRFMGTSRNTGSDKQTYYKLSLCGKDGDSVREMAETFYSGGGVMGEHALCEAAYSTRCFMRLVELGVPFPTNEFGEYAGYKTDHDPRTRATSCGPLTSKYMTEALERSVISKGIEIVDGQRVIKILTADNTVMGIA
ncbi:MAG: FAD-binding protein, partial [Clostridia bacterium]|nr:FAD-binding protein [Clostridia bacterium]